MASTNPGAFGPLQNLAAPSVAPPVELPRGLVTGEFSLADLPASLTDSKLYRVVAGPAGVTTAQIPIRPAFRGSVVGLALQSTEAKTAGTARFEAFVKGSEGAFLVWETGTLHGVSTFPAGTYPFAVGDDIDVRVTTTASFTPTSADVEVVVYLAQSSAGSEN